MMVKWGLSELLRHEVEVLSDDGLLVNRGDPAADLGSLRIIPRIFLLPRQIIIIFESEESWVSTLIILGASDNL